MHIYTQILLENSNDAIRPPTPRIFLLPINPNRLGKKSAAAPLLLPVRRGRVWRGSKVLFGLDYNQHSIA
jgi:hypothetical protein